MLNAHNWVRWIITLIDRFEAKQMQAQLPADYAQLYEVLENSNELPPP